MRAMLALILLCFFPLAGCKTTTKADSREAVQKAIEAYLEQRQNLMLTNMDLEVGEVKFEGETATAEVTFRSKQSSTVTVTVHYKLKRRGQGWQVESSIPASGPGSSPHDGMTSSVPAPSHDGTAPEPSH